MALRVASGSRRSGRGMSRSAAGFGEDPVFAPEPREELRHRDQTLGLGAEGQRLAVTLAVDEKGVLIGRGAAPMSPPWPRRQRSPSEGNEVSQIASSAFDCQPGVVMDLHPFQVVVCLGLDRGHSRLLQDGRPGDPGRTGPAAGTPTADRAFSLAVSITRPPNAKQSKP